MNSATLSENRFCPDNATQTGSILIDVSSTAFDEMLDKLFVLTNQIY